MKERSTRCPPKRRILSAFLALAMLLTLLPVTAFARDQTETKNGVDYIRVNDYPVWWITGTYKGNATSLTLENYINGQAVNYMQAGVFKGNTTLTYIKLPDNGMFSTIGDEAFAGCTNLETVDAPTTLGDVGERAFQGCTKLKSLALGSNSAHIYESAFEGCTSLENVQITGTVVYIEDTAFKGCTNLTSVTLPKYLKKMGNNVFEGCTSLEEITLPKEIESFGDNVFKDCTKLKKIIYNGKSTEWANCPAKGKIPDDVQVVCTEPLTTYDISVCGTKANEANCSNVLGDGTVEFKPKTSSLVLSNANLSYNDASTAAIDSTLDKLTIAGDGDDTIENTSGPAIKTTGALILDSSHIVLKGSRAIVAESVTIDAYECWYRTASDEPYAEYTESADIGNTNYLEIIHSQDNPNETGITLWIDGKRMPEEELYDVFGDGTALLEEYGVHGEMYCTLNLKNANWESADTAILTRVDQLTISGTGTIKGENNSIRTENTGTVYGAGVSIDEANLTFTGGLDLASGASITNSTVKINGWTEYGIKAGSNLIIDGSDVTIQDANGVGEYALRPQIVQMYGNSTLRLQGAKSIANGGDQRCIIYTKYWYRTSPDDEYTEGTDEIFKLDPSYTYYELTTKDPDAVEKYNLWVAGKQVTETNQNDVLDDGTVAYDPTTNTLTLHDANLTLDENADDGGYCCIASELEEELTITGAAILSNADGIMTAGPLTLDSADLTLTGHDEDGGEDAIRVGDHSDKDLFLRNSKVTIAGTNSEGNFFNFGIRCGKLTVADSTLDVKANGSAIAADTMEVSGADTIVMAETDSTDEEEFYALALDDETSLTLNDGLALVAGKVNESKTAKIAQPEQIPDPTGYAAYWVVRPGDEKVQTMQIPSAIVANEEEAHLFAGWFLEDDVTRLEDSPYYLGPDYVGNLDRDVTFHGRWCTRDQLRTLTFEDCTVMVNGGLKMGYPADTSPVQLAPGSRVTLTLDESKVTEGMVFNGFVIDPIPADLTVSGHTATFTMPDDDTTVTVNHRTESEGGSDDFGTILVGGAVVGVAGVVAYEVGTELVLDQLLPADVAVPRTRAELALLLWNTAGRPAPASRPAFADVTDPDLASAAQWSIEQGYLNARADGAFKPEKNVAKWRVIRGYKAVAQQ